MLLNDRSCYCGNSNYIEGMDLSGWDVSKVTECNGLLSYFNSI